MTRQVNNLGHCRTGFQPSRSNSLCFVYKQSVHVKHHDPGACRTSCLQLNSLLLCIWCATEKVVMLCAATHTTAAQPRIQLYNKGTMQTYEKAACLAHALYTACAYASFTVAGYSANNMFRWSAACRSDIPQCAKLCPLPHRQLSASGKQPAAVPGLSQRLYHCHHKVD